MTPATLASRAAVAMRPRPWIRRSVSASTVQQEFAQELSGDGRRPLQPATFAERRPRAPRLICGAVRRGPGHHELGLEHLAAVSSGAGDAF